MTDQSIDVVLVAITALIVTIVVYALFREYQREEKVFKQARKKLAEKTVVVAIRTKDGKRNHWETLFIKQLMDLGATVLDFQPENGNNLWAGDRNCIPTGAMAFVGTTWEANHDWYIDGKFLPVRTNEVVANRNETVLAPFFSVHRHVSELHTNIAECVSSYL